MCGVVRWRTKCAVAKGTMNRASVNVDCMMKDGAHYAPEVAGAARATLDTLLSFH